MAAGGTLDDIVKLSILMQDLSDFAKVNTIMTEYFTQPYPARATYQVAALPKGGLIEIEGILVLQAPPTNPQTGWLETFDQTKGQ
jgi:enamine deaminase RidA (YjgF/YER057c/UK114 family)